MASAIGDLVGDDCGRPADVAFQAEHLRPQDAVGDLALRVVDQLRPRHRPGVAAQTGVEGVERQPAARIDEHTVDVGERVVPGGAR